MTGLGWLRNTQDFFFFFYLKGYCTIFQHALKSLEIIGIVLSSRMSKTARKNSKGLKSYKEFKFQLAENMQGLI